MKNILIILLLMCAAIRASAQLGVTGGMNFTKYTLKINGAKQPRSSIISYNVGLVYRTRGKRVSLQPAVEYSVKGTRNYETPFGSGLDYYHNKLNYLQFTLPVIRKWELVKGISYDIGVGPYAGYLNKATSKTVAFSGADKTTDFKIGNDSTSAFKRWDAGVTFLMGVKLYHVGFYFLYDLGIADIDPKKSYVIKTRDFRMNLSIYF